MSFRDIYIYKFELSGSRISFEYIWISSGLSLSLLSYHQLSSEWSTCRHPKETRARDQLLPIRRHLQLAVIFFPAMRKKETQRLCTYVVKSKSITGNGSASSNQTVSGNSFSLAYAIFRLMSRDDVHDGASVWWHLASTPSYSCFLIYIMKRGRG